MRSSTSVRDSRRTWAFLAGMGTMLAFERVAGLAAGGARLAVLADRQEALDDPVGPGNL